MRQNIPRLIFFIRVGRYTSVVHASYETFQCRHEFSSRFVPFVGGFVGYLGYEALGIKILSSSLSLRMQSWVFISDFIVLDHIERIFYFVSLRPDRYLGRRHGLFVVQLKVTLMDERKTWKYAPVSNFIFSDSFAVSRWLCPWVSYLRPKLACAGVPCWIEFSQT
jgi:anthranilate/para-aminobenzoate synthase component I